MTYWFHSRMYRVFYIFNQFNEIAKSKIQQNKYIKVKKKKKETEKSIKKNSDKKSVAGNGDLIIFLIASLCEKLNS